MIACVLLTETVADVLVINPIGQRHMVFLSPCHLKGLMGTDRVPKVHMAYTWLGIGKKIRRIPAVVPYSVSTQRETMRGLMTHLPCIERVNHLCKQIDNIYSILGILATTTFLP